MVSVLNKVSKAALATLMLVTSTTWAHGDNLGQEVEHDDAEIIEQIRAEQNAYFKQIEEDAKLGIWNSGDTSCKYISSIGPAPLAKTVTLTFDDGPSSTLTPVVLDVLAKYGVKATFFMKGAAAKGKASLVQRIRREGHIVASHSYSHPNFHTLSQGQQISEITTTDSLIGSEMPANLKLFRYPYGNSTCYANASLKKMGYRGIVGWHVDSCDWAFAKDGYVTRRQAEICGVAPANMGSYAQHVVSSVKKRNGGIVLMHEIHQRTAYSVEEIIVRLQREGFTFNNLNDPRMAAYMK